MSYQRLSMDGKQLIASKVSDNVDLDGASRRIPSEELLCLVLLQCHLSWKLEFRRVVVLMIFSSSFAYYCEKTAN
jgi:hypothetical protein